MVLMTFHMIGMIVCTNSLYYAVPSMFPSMPGLTGKYWLVFKWFLPIGICFAVILYGANAAYLYCSVAFLQFMKEANIVIVFLFAAILGMQQLSRTRVIIIAWVVAGAFLCVSGDKHFSITGFVLQIIAQIAECMRTIMAEWVLSRSELKLDPLTYTRFIAPICLIILVVGVFITWNKDVLAAIRDWWPVIIPNVLIAFSLNVIITAYIKRTSAIGFVITGIVKDIILVIISAILFRGDIITHKQYAFFVVTLTGVLAWSFMKVFPNHRIVTFFEWMCGQPQIEANEDKALISKGKDSAGGQREP